MKILIMEDEIAIQKMLAKCLKRKNIEFEIVSEGKEAIEKYINAKTNNSPFDLVILDLKVNKGLNGSETIKELKKLDPNVKAIVSSGYFPEPIIDNYLQYGFIGILPKPYSINDLYAIIEQYA